MRTFVTTLLIVSALSLSFAFTPVAEKATDSGNLKVLPANITEEQLDSVMDHFKAALGVKCSFCHAMDPDTSKGRHLDFASDAKPEKEVARNMMRMTAYLNANYFNPEHSTQTDTLKTVMCFTCHRGSTHIDSDDLLPQVDSIIELQHKKH